MILPMKRVEDVEARRAALEAAQNILMASKKGALSGHKLADQMKSFEANIDLNTSVL